MAVNIRHMTCTPEDVFAVLADGWLLPVWVVGASRMRSVDEKWPAVGSHVDHSFGVWPLLVNDATTVEEWDAPTHMVIRPKGWPIGEARVSIDVKPRKGGCIVRLEEHPVAGPATFVPTRLMDVSIYLRNIETLQRLAYIAEGTGTRGREAGSGAGA